eukprot:gene1056-10575_t
MNEEQIQELEVLASIYEENFEIISKEPTKFEIKLQNSEEVQISLVVEYTKSYPNQPCKFNVENRKGLLQEDIKEILENLKESSNEYINSEDVYVFSLVSNLQEIISNRKSSLVIDEKMKSKYPTKIEFKPILKILSSANLELIQYPQFLKNRTGFAMTSFQSDIYIHGGSSGKKLYHDFYSFNFNERKWYSYYFEDDLIQSPKLKNHHMFIYSKQDKYHLYLYDKTETIYSICISDDVRDRNWKQWKFFQTKEIPVLKGSIPIQIHSIIYEFGGINQYDECSQSMIISDLSTMKRYSYDDFNSIETPSPRYDYSICENQNRIYLFGGRNEKNEIFNDLYVFWPLNFEWNRIEIHGLLPPPLYSSTLFSDKSNSLFLYGGKSFEKEEEYSKDSIFYFSKSNWSSLIITGPSLPSNIQSDQYQIPRMNHQSQYVSDTLFISDGFIDSKKKNSATHSILIHGLLDINQTLNNNPNIITHLMKMKNEKIDCDIIFYTFNEDKSGYNEIHVHKCIIASRCKYFKNLILDNNDKIYLNDVSTSILDSYFNFLYSGVINLKSEIEIFEFLNFSKKCKTHYTLINKIINSQEIYIDLHKSIIENIKNDFHSLINDKLFSNIKFEIIEQEEEQEEQEKKEIFVHKIFLERSNYFKSILQSGMKESIENMITFSDIKFETMNQILYFLYTDDLIFESNNTIEIYINSVLYQLNEIIDYCRKIIISNIDFDNSLDLLFLSDLYADSRLLRSCIQFIVNHYDMYEEEDLKSIPSSVSFQIIQIVSKRQKIFERKEKKQLMREAKSQLSKTNNIINRSQLRGAIAQIKKRKNIIIANENKDMNKEPVEEEEENFDSQREDFENNFESQGNFNNADARYKAIVDEEESEKEENSNNIEEEEEEEEENDLDSIFNDKSDEKKKGRNKPKKAKWSKKDEENLQRDLKKQARERRIEHPRAEVQQKDLSDICLSLVNRRNKINVSLDPFKINPKLTADVIEGLPLTRKQRKKSSGNDSDSDFELVIVQKFDSDTKKIDDSILYEDINSFDNTQMIMENKDSNQKIIDNTQDYSQHGILHEENIDEKDEECFSQETISSQEMIPKSSNPESNSEIQSSVELMIGDEFAPSKSLELENDLINFSSQSDGDNEKEEEEDDDDDDDEIETQKEMNFSDNEEIVVLKPKKVRLSQIARFSNHRGLKLARKSQQLSLSITNSQDACDEESKDASSDSDTENEEENEREISNKMTKRYKLEKSKRKYQSLSFDIAESPASTTSSSTLSIVEDDFLIEDVNHKPKKRKRSVNTKLASKFAKNIL